MPDDFTRQWGTLGQEGVKEKWRQQIIVVVEHEFSNIEGIWIYTT